LESLKNPVIRSKKLGAGAEITISGSIGAPPPLTEAFFVGTLHFFLANFPTLYFRCHAGEPNFSLEVAPRRFREDFLPPLTADRTRLAALTTLRAVPAAFRSVLITAGVCWLIPC
jgi:hypothetical protein